MNEKKLVKVAIASLTIIATLATSAKAVNDTVVREKVESQRGTQIVSITHQHRD